MIIIIPCKDRFEELVHFVTRLNRNGTHHIGFFGESEADVRSSLAGCLIRPAEGFQLACDDNRLVGIFGVDADVDFIGTGASARGRGIGADLLTAGVDWMLSASA